MESIRIILEELHILIAPDEQHEKVFTYITIIGFKKGKGQKDHAVRSNLSKIQIYIDVAGSSGPCGSKGLACELCKLKKKNSNFKKQNHLVAIPKT